MSFDSDDRDTAVMADLAQVYVQVSCSDCHAKFDTTLGELCNGGALPCPACGHRAAGLDLPRPADTRPWSPSPELLTFCAGR